MLHMERDKRRQSRVTTSHQGGWLTDWQPGMALPARFTTTIEGDWLPYLIRLDLVATEGEVSCASLTVEEREGDEPITARGLRDIPLGECIRLATASALRPVRQEAGALVIELAGAQGELEPVQLEGRQPQRRLDPGAIKEAADIYLAADEKPTKAVQLKHSQAPISHSTAARWVMQARKAGLIPPATRRKPKGKDY